MNKKRFGAFVVATMLALVIAVPAQAATRAEIMAQIAMLQAQLAILVGGTSANFTMDMTVGSTGGEVTRLQSFLIGKGYGIPAGATGYFGEQTRSALARYQAANAVSPAVGYFGPLTRTKVNSMLVVANPVPTPTPDQNNDNDADADDARNAISDLEDAIDDADDDIGNNEDEARDILDEARDVLAEAEDALDDRDYDDAVDLADEGMDLVDDARDEAGLDDNGDNDQNDAEDAIDDLDAAIDDAQDDIDNAEDDGEDVDDANDLLDDARAMFDDAENAFDDEDYDEAVDLADEGMDLVDEALDEIGSGNDGDAETSRTSAETTVVNGSDNDYATFEIELDLTAFGDDMYIPRNGDDGFTYRIENASDGSTVAGGTRSESLSSSADDEGNYFVLREDEKETFTFRVTFDPSAADEGKTFRMQLLTIEYSDEQQAPTATWSTQEDNEFETKATYIAD